MSSSRQSNNLINKLHEGSLRPITDITLHQKYLQILKTKVYKIIKSEAMTIMENIFIFRKNIHKIITQNFQITGNEEKNEVRYGFTKFLQKNVSFRIL